MKFSNYISTPGLVSGLSLSVYGVYQIASKIAGYVVSPDIAQNTLPTDASQVAISDLYAKFQENSAMLSAAAEQATQQAYKIAIDSKLPVTMSAVIAPTLQFAGQIGSSAYGLMKTNLYSELGVYAVASGALIYTGTVLKQKYYSEGDSLLEGTKNMLKDGAIEISKFASSLGGAFFVATTSLGALLSTQNHKSFQRNFDAVTFKSGFEALKPKFNDAINYLSEKSNGMILGVRTFGQNMLDAMKSNDYLSSARSFFFGAASFVATRPVAIGLPAVAILGSVAAYRNIDSFKKGVDNTCAKILEMPNQIAKATGLS